MADSPSNILFRLGRMRAVAILALAGCLVAFFETRGHHVWHRLKMKEINKVMTGDDFHPMMIVDDSYEHWAQAVRLILSDPVVRFWLKTTDHTLYAPVVVNHFLYPGHEGRMSRETQIALVNNWLYGNFAPIRHEPPRLYDKGIEVSHHVVRYIEVASDDGRTTSKLTRNAAL